jgi:hypothetical protein
MIVSDPFVVRALGGHPSHLLDYSVQIILAIGVVVAAKVWIRYRAPQGETVIAESEE